MNKSCFIEDCFKYKEKNTSFHRFPNNPALCKRWSRSIRDLNNQKNSFHFHRSSYVCGHHFKDCDKHISGKKTLLHKNAVPSIFPGLIGAQHNQIEVMETESSELSDESELLMECVDPLAETNTSAIVESSQSDCDDFFGFEAADLNLRNETVSTSTGDIIVEEVKNDSNHNSQSVSKEADDDVIIIENNVEVIEIDDNQRNQVEAKEADDEIIIVENTVEVIEIDDDDDSEVPPPLPPPLQALKHKKYSTYDIQQMVYSNNPLIELRKPKLNWKSDQFRFVYINGEEQNLCICTKCSELFFEINIDTIVRHARCNPTPSVSPTTKRKKVNVQSGETSATLNTGDTLETSVQNLTISKIQTIAACMDVQKSTFFQGKRFLHFAQFLIDAGASAATNNKSKFICEPKYNVLCTFRDQLKDSQVSKICSILNNPDLHYSLSCDVWEDTFRRKTNVLLELHYLDPSFHRHRIVIGMRAINGMMRSMVDDAAICEQIVQILKVYSNEKNGLEFIEKAISFVTFGNFDLQTLGSVSIPSACSVINDVANEIVNVEKLKIAEKCLQMIALLNLVSTEKITLFDARKWENVYQLLHTFHDKKSSIMQREMKTILLQVLEPLRNAIKELSDTKNDITKVFSIYKMLETNLLPLSTDKEIMKSVKYKALGKLKKAFVDSDVYQICMFLDPSNRDQYNALESDKMDSLQSKIDTLINPYTTKTENGCVDNDLINYMDDSVTSQQNQIDLFLQLAAPTKDDALEFWRCNNQMPGLKALARKYFTIPTYASLSECIFSNEAKEYLVQRSSVEIKDLETMLMMNSSQIDVDHTNVS